MACCRSYGVSVGSSGARSAISGSSGGTQETPIGREASIWRTLAALELFSYRLGQAVYRFLCASEIKESLEHFRRRCQALARFPRIITRSIEIRDCLLSCGWT